MDTPVPFVVDAGRAGLPPGKMLRLLPDGRAADDYSLTVLVEMTQHGLPSRDSAREANPNVTFIPSAVVLWVDDEGRPCAAPSARHV